MGGKVAGCLQLTMIRGLSHRGATRAQIEAVRVDSALRGQGIGERLVRYAVEMARANGCNLVQLTTDRSRGERSSLLRTTGFS